MGELKDKVQLSREEILKRYFGAYYSIDFFIKYNQISVDESIRKIDATPVVNYYSTYINMFLGANCSNVNKLNFENVKWLFLSGKQYTKENLDKLNLDFDFDKVPEINLSNNDFGKYDYVWNFGQFLCQIYNNVYSYICRYFMCELSDAKEEDEAEFEIYGFYSGDATEYVINKIEDIMKPIMAKLVPNVQNTNMRILIDLNGVGSRCIFELVEDLLKRGNFDGCYIKVECRNPEFTSKFDLSETDFELYQYQPIVSLNRKRVKN